MTKQTKWLCAQRRLRSWSDKSSSCAQWVAKDPSFLHADSEDSDQTGRMPRLIWVFSGRTYHFVGFAMRRLNSDFAHCLHRIGILLKRQPVSPWLLFEPVSPCGKVTYHIDEQPRFRRAWTSTLSRQNLHCLLTHYGELEETSDKEPYLWPYRVAGNARLKDQCTTLKSLLSCVALVFHWLPFAKWSQRCCCLFGFNVAFNNVSVSHITTVSGCDRELNAHFYSAASLKYHGPDTWHDSTSSHIILILGWPVVALSRKSECQARSS